MYVPTAFEVTDRQEAAAMVRAAGAGNLVTVAPDGRPTATRLPVIWDGGDRLVAHLAKANPHWRLIGDGAPALVIVDGPQAYVSPSWYPAKAEHGKVVPTWNYTAVHLSGTAVVRDDPGFLRDVVGALTDEQEEAFADPWHVDDAPADYLDAMLRAIVGVEMTIERVEAKAKLSQNRSPADRRGVIAGLRGRDPDDAVAAAMAR